MSEIYDAIVHTPIWVFPLFAYLLFVGFKATNPGTVPLGKLVVLPIVFTVMGIESMINNFGITLFTVTTYGGAFFLGSLGGWLIVRRWQIVANRETWEVTVPGSWTTMILILLIFSTKYFFGYQLSNDPDLLQQTNWEVAFLAANGICTGLFVGRVGYFFHLCRAAS